MGTRLAGILASQVLRRYISQSRSLGPDIRDAVTSCVRHPRAALGRCSGVPPGSRDLASLYRPSARAHRYARPGVAYVRARRTPRVGLIVGFATKTDRLL